MNNIRVGLISDTHGLLRAEAVAALRGCGHIMHAGDVRTPKVLEELRLPGPCFRTSMVIHGGASGGPVVGPEGTVFAVNSTGFKDDKLSYVKR